MTLDEFKKWVHDHIDFDQYYDGALELIYKEFIQK